MAYYLGARCLLAMSDGPSLHLVVIIIPYLLPHMPSDGDCLGQVPGGVEFYYRLFSSTNYRC